MPVTERAVTDRVWLNVEEAAARTGVSRTELLNALQTGELRGTQRVPRGRWRLHVDDLDHWMRGGKA